MMQLSPKRILFFAFLATCCYGQRSNNRRQDVINEWIRTIREAPKGHSMSPSWSSKQRPQVIGVGELPLQNEVAGPGGSGPRASQKPSLGFKFKNPFSSRPKRYNSAPPPNNDYSRPRENFKQKNPLLTRYQELEVSKFKPLNPENRPEVKKPSFQRPPRSNFDRKPQSYQKPSNFEEPNFPSLSPFGGDELDFGFTRKPLEPKPEGQRPNSYERYENVVQEEDENPFRTKPFDFGQRPSFQDDYSRPKRRPIIENDEFRDEFRPNSRPSFNERPNSRPSFDEQPNLFNPRPLLIEETPRLSPRPIQDTFSQRPIQEERPNFAQRPKRPSFDFEERPFNNNKRPSFNFEERPFQTESRPKRRPQRPRKQQLDFEIRRPTFDFNEGSRRNSELTDQLTSSPFKTRPLNGQNSRPRRKRPQFLEDQITPRQQRPEFIETIPQRTTTPRPIPTPGPMDFPMPPPRRPRPPPTHPTHPPLITHPPEHYATVTRLPPSFNEVSDAKINDNIYQDFDDQDYDYKEKNYDYQDNSIEEKEEGFFSYPGTFPSLQDLGAGFESMKLNRKKRSVAPEDPLMTSELRIRYRRPNRRRRNRNRNERRQGFGFNNNFWDDSNVDADDFFSNFNNNYNDFYQQNQGSGQRRDPYTEQQRRDPYTEQQRNYNEQRRDPYTEQTIQSYPENNYYNDPYSGYGEILNNEILGSGNFEVIKGGTFYDQDTYYYSTYNRRPQYGEQLFENFRDFADIKNDRYNSYEYPKY